MKAITLHQPWASLIAEGVKTIETRSWAPPAALWGERIAIHAATRKPTVDYPACRHFGYGIVRPFPARRGRCYGCPELCLSGELR